MPYLELDTDLGRRGDERIGLGERSGEGFFHKDRDAALERRDSNSGVVRGRDRDRHRTHAAQERVKIGKPPNSYCGFNLATARSIDVIETDELDLLQMREMPGVVQAENADADNANRQSRGHAGTPRADCSRNERKRSTSSVCGVVRSRSMAWETGTSALKTIR